MNMKFSCCLLPITIASVGFVVSEASPGRVNREPAAQASAPASGLSASDVQWLKKETLRQLQGCRVQGAGGVWIYTPDGMGKYGALWTRDFYYMVEYAGDLLDPSAVKACIQYLLRGQREDGCIPDRVNAKGRPLYSPGGPNNQLADHALDNGAFMALIVCSYVERSGDEELFREVEAALRRGLDHTRRARNGLVYNDSENPQCVYGFTDIVKKSGNLLFSSLVYEDACRRMGTLAEKTKCGAPVVYATRAMLIRKNLTTLWNDEVGMFWAADERCRQIDIWGSALAVFLGLANETQSRRIVDYLSANKNRIILRGQIRHLAGNDKQWELLFESCKPGTYQNGAYWATPLAWFVPAIQKHNPVLASEIVRAAVKDFKENGIHECINDAYAKLPNFVVSATNVYGLTRSTKATQEVDPDR